MKMKRVALPPVDSRNCMLNKIIETLDAANSIVLATHVRPDGDAIGSELALGLFLKARGKEVHIINQDPAPYNLEWLPGWDSIEVYDRNLDQIKAIAGADVIVILDTNAASRVGEAGEQMKGSGATSILIDHHTEPEPWFDLMHRRESASSTAELVYEIMAAWDVDGIDSDVATCLYTAIMTDTGSFRYSNVTADLHRIIADLIERGGLDSAVIQAEVYDKRSLEGIRLMSRVLDTIELHYGGELGTMVITRRALGDSGASIEEADGFVNYLLSVEGVRVATIFTETERGTKVSFRSKGEDHVHSWAHVLGGGGHRNASGAFLKQPLEQALRTIIDTAPRYINFVGEHAEEGSPLVGRHRRRAQADVNSSTEGLSSEDSEYLSALLDSQARNSDK